MTRASSGTVYPLSGSCDKLCRGCGSVLGVADDQGGPPRELHLVAQDDRARRALPEVAGRAVYLVDSGDTSRCVSGLRTDPLCQEFGVHHPQAIYINPDQSVGEQQTGCCRHRHFRGHDQDADTGGHR